MTANMDHTIISEYLTTQDTAYKNRLHSYNISVHKKLKALITQYNETNTAVNINDKAIFNATDMDIPEDILTLLSLGPKFALPIETMKDTPLFHLMAELESVLNSNNNKDTQDSTRCKAINIIYNYINNFPKHNPHDEPIRKFCQAALKNSKHFFKTNDHLCILSADKGNRTVIMTKHDYELKMTTLINDDETYIRLNKDPTSGYQTKNNDFARRLNNLKLIDDKTKRWLITYNSICPRIYGQPKAHKANLPLRPVIPNVTAPTYRMAKYIANILKHSVNSKYNIINTYEFCDLINQTTIPEGHIIVSLDVVSLFTNIPRQLVIRNIIKNWENIKTDINLDLFLEMVEFCMESSYFQYKGQYYKQTFGSPMGSPLSPILADIVLESIIDDAIKSLSCHIPLIKKYVDDLFLIIPEQQSQVILDTFNKQEKRIQFTMECENDGKLPYLDLLINRPDDQTLTTEWYAKPIASGRMLNYHSFHQMRHKINTANNFIHRVNYFSNKMQKPQRKQIIHSHLQKNGFPKSLINRLINNYSAKRMTEQISPNNISAVTDQPSIQHVNTSIETTFPNNNSNQAEASSLQPPNSIATEQTTPNNTSSVTSQPNNQHINNSINTLHHINSNPAEASPLQPPNEIPPHNTCNIINTTGAYIIRPPPDIIRPTASHITADSQPVPPQSSPQHNAASNKTGTTSLLNNNNSPAQNIVTQPRAAEEENLQNKTYFPMIYIPQLTDNIIKLLRKNYPQVIISTRQHRAVKCIHSRMKDPVKKEDKNNVIYKINCSLCPKSYIGKTSCRLSARLAGHKSDVNKMNKVYADRTNAHTQLDNLRQKTALLSHCIDTKHNFDFTNTIILDHSYNSHTLSFLEMAHIKTTTNVVNKRTDVEGLNTAYAAILNNYTKLTKR